MAGPLERIPRGDGGMLAGVCAGLARQPSRSRRQRTARINRYPSGSRKVCAQIEPHPVVELISSWARSSGTPKMTPSYPLWSANSASTVNPTTSL